MSFSALAALRVRMPPADTDVTARVIVVSNKSLRFIVFLHAFAIL